jgi:Trk K+ transport system NAD-binding subunit
LTIFEELDVEVWELHPEAGSIITQMSLKEIDFPKESIVGVINHHGHLSIARGDTQISHEDVVLVFGKNNSIDKMRKLFSVK